MKRLSFYLSLSVLLIGYSYSFAVPPEIKPKSDPIIIEACTPTILPIEYKDAVNVLYIAHEAIEFTPKGILANKLDEQVTCVTVGDYQGYVVASSATGELTKKLINIRVVPRKKPAPIDPPVDPNPPVVPPVVPDPPITPPVVPTTKGQIFVYFVENTNDAATIRAHLFDAGQPLRKFQDVGGHKVSALPINSTDPQFTRYAALAKTWVAKGNRLPYMVILSKNPDGSAKIEWEGATPDAPKDVLTLFQKYGK